MSTKPSEVEVVRTVTRLLKQNGWLEIRREAQFCERYLDILARNRTNGKYLAVEAKVSSPSRAFKQASRYMHIAQRVYVAVYAKTPTPLAVSLAKKYGIGLILVGANKKRKLSANVAIEALDSNLFERRLAKTVWQNGIALSRKQ